ncbi:MAG: uroporphyrinogen decarboxylase family protein, partial [Candidatus Latescibacterota bacterium]
MTGRERIRAALSGTGAEASGAVICYEGIFVRDHWDALTGLPWWYAEAPDPDLQLAWRRRAIPRTGLDWFHLPQCPSREYRARYTVEEREGRVVRLDRVTGTARELSRPRIGGWGGPGLHSVHPESLAITAAAIEQSVPDPPERDPAEVRRDGRADLADLLLAELGGERYPLVHVASPLWRCYQLWGFEGMMTMVATRPDLVERVCHRGLALERFAVREAAALGAAGIWIEECLTDMIAPRAFARLNLPVLQELVAEIRAAGMQSIYYYCGDPRDRWDLLYAVGADALSLEESKKGFTVEIEEAVDRAGGRAALLGNLDAIGVLQDGGEEELRREVARQLAAG